MQYARGAFDAVHNGVSSAATYLRDGAKQSFDTLDVEEVRSRLAKSSNDLTAVASAHLTKAKETVLAIKVEDLPAQIRDYIKEHPYQSAFYVFQGVLYLCPGTAFYGPLLKMLGFGPNGPTAGMSASYNYRNAGLD